MKISLTGIGKRLMKARKEKGLSIDQAAALTGYSVPTLRRYEQKGIRDLITLADICEAYGINLPDILFGPSPRLVLEFLPPEARKFIRDLAALIKQDEC